MSRAPRVIVAGTPYHVTQRGNHGADVFFTPDDRQQYLIWLREYADRYGLKVWAYCLMTNHVHLVVLPATRTALAEVSRALLMRYTRRINAEYEWEGHLWRARYYACALDDAHLKSAVRYVEQNPVRAGLVGEASAYPWSSAAPHCGLRPDPVLADDLPLLGRIRGWAAWLEEQEADETLALLRLRTEKGLPCGSQAFINKIARLLGRQLTPRPRGRPRKGAA